MEYLDTSNSSSIKWAGYDKATHMLRVQFTENEIEYEYYKVPVKKWKELEAAKSKGVYINTLIKPFYEYKRVE
jgi:KTSC domain-containing protein